jgi:hypothetical protein
MHRTPTLPSKVLERQAAGPALAPPKALGGGIATQGKGMRIEFEDAKPVNQWDSLSALHQPWLGTGARCLYPCEPVGGDVASPVEK